MQTLRQYDVDELIARKLAQRLRKRGVYYFEVADPQPLVDEQKRKISVARLISKELTKRKAKTQSEVFVMEGAQGVHDLYDQVVQEGEDLYLIGANAQAYAREPERFLLFDEQRTQKGIKRFHLSITDTQGSAFNELPNTKVRYLPNTFSSPMVIWIFGRWVAQALWETPETIFLVRNKQLAEDYRKYFQLLWESVGK